MRQDNMETKKRKLEPQQEEIVGTGETEYVFVEFANFSPDERRVSRYLVPRTAVSEEQMALLVSVNGKTNEDLWDEEQARKSESKGGEAEKDLDDDIRSLLERWDRYEFFVGKYEWQPRHVVAFFAYEVDEF